MTDVTSVLAGWLRASPMGARTWLRGLGRSMWPLLDSGDALQVERCAPNELRPGEIALGQRSDGGLSAHLVVAMAPPRTASFLGAADPPLELLGRVVAMERFGLRAPLPRTARWALLALHHSARVVRGLRRRSTRPRADGIKPR